MSVIGRVKSELERFHGDDRAQLFGGTRIGEVLGMSESEARSDAFPRNFNVDNFDTFGGDVTAGKFTEVARFKVPAGTEYWFGYGSAKNPENQGYLYVDLKNGSSAAVEGTIRFTIQSETGRREQVIADFDTTKLDASKSDRTQQVPLPSQKSKAYATQDSFLVVKMNPASNGTVSSANSEVIVPVTENDISGSA